MPRPSTVSTRSHTTVYFIFLLTLAFSLTWALFTTTAPGVRAEGSIRTVCLSGPPACDYASIQAAIDASAAGDEIVVESGVYTEALTLRDQIAIRGAESATTTLTAAAGSIIQASDVASVTLSHLVLDGRDVLTSGMSLTNVNIVLDHIIIRDLTGSDGSSLGSPHGDDVIGLSLSGVGSLEAYNLQIQRLEAGNGLIDSAGYWAPSYQGGNAIGVAVSGTYDVNIISSSITDLTAGDAGDANQDGLSCSGEGGHAVGIEAFSSDVKLDAVEIRNLQGGTPCRGRGSYCFDRAGSYSGIMIDGGRLTLTNSTIDNLHAYAGHGSPVNSATWVQNAIAVRIQNLRIDHGVTSIPAEPNTTVHSASVDTYPFCFPPPLKVQSVSLNNVTQVDLRNLDARNVIGYGTRATSAGLFIQDADRVSVRNSKVSNVHGGYGGLNAYGMYLARINQLTINATAIHSVEAQAGPPYVDHTYGGDDGGSATGLTIDDVESGSITGTSIWRVVGGDAQNTDHSAGNASGIVLQQSVVDVVHNTIAATSPGLPRSLDGEDGVSYGILSDGGDVHVAATVIARHMYGLTNRSGSMSTDQISLWENGIDYSGVSPSPTDLYTDPDLVDLDGGNIHLRADSGLIDQANRFGPLSRMPDIDGQPRPQDGNGDGVYRADIGADEYFIVNDVLHLQAIPERAGAGELIQVLAVIENPSSTESQTGILFTSPVPAGMRLEPNSLYASSGGVNLTPEDGIERVVWTGDLPAENAVTIRYDLRVPTDANTSEWVTLEADTTGDKTEMDRHAEVDILINPPQILFPQIQYVTD